MHPTSQPSAVGPRSESLRESEERREAFDREMVDAHLRADRSKKRQLQRRWRISQILAGDLKPWYTQQQIYDDLLASGADHDRVLAIAENHVLYVKRQIAKRTELPSPATALRLVVKEVGEALSAQIACDQNPTPENRQRAELETRDAMRVKETYIMALYHRVEHACQALGSMARGGNGNGQRTW